MDKLECVVGGFDTKLRGKGNTTGKFVVTHEDGKLKAYNLDFATFDEGDLAEVTKKIGPSHFQIPDHYGVPRDGIVGGGQYSLRDGVLTLEGKSMGFGPVPTSVAEAAANHMAEHYRQLGVEVTEIKVEKYDSWGLKQKHIDLWRKLGYEL